MIDTNQKTVTGSNYYSRRP